MEQKKNSGAIFKNDYKQEDKHPDYKGTVDVEGKLFDIALWLNESKQGKKYFGVKVDEHKEKEAKPDALGEPENDLPF